LSWSASCQYTLLLSDGVGEEVQLLRVETIVVYWVIDSRGESVCVVNRGGERRTSSSLFNDARTKSLL
jgi:hypothetical protein